MSQLTIKVSAKGEAMIATLQKEIFNRRRKKVTSSQVVETLVESGAKSQSDKRYAASWSNLIKDIEKAAKVAEIHGDKPSNITSDEWALILSYRTRKGLNPKKATAKRGLTKKLSSKKSYVKKAVAKKTSAKKIVTKNTSVITAPSKSDSKVKVKASKVKKVVKKVAAAQEKKEILGSNSVSKRIVKPNTSKTARRTKKTKAKAA